VNYAPIKKVSRSRTHDFFIFYLVPPGSGTVSEAICPFIWFGDLPQVRGLFETNLPLYLVPGFSPRFGNRLRSNLPFIWFVNSPPGPGPVRKLNLARSVAV